MVVKLLGSVREAPGQSANFRGRRAEVGLLPLGAAPGTIGLGCDAGVGDDLKVAPICSNLQAGSPLAGRAIATLTWPHLRRFGRGESDLPAVEPPSSVFRSIHTDHATDALCQPDQR